METAPLNRGVTDAGPVVVAAGLRWVTVLGQPESKVGGMSDETPARLSDDDRSRLIYLLLLERFGPDKLRLTLSYLERRPVEAAATGTADEAAALEDLVAVLAEATLYGERPNEEHAGGFLRDLSAALARVVLGVDIRHPAARAARVAESRRRCGEAHSRSGSALESCAPTTVPGNVAVHRLIETDETGGLPTTVVLPQTGVFIGADDDPAPRIDHVYRRADDLDPPIYCYESSRPATASG
jgi:hypothetical protein